MLVRISEAAKVLGVHPNTLKRWESEGKIQPKITLGKHRRYDMDELMDMLGGKKDEQHKGI